MRIPKVLAIPLCVLGAVIWIGDGIASLTAKPKLTVYADPEVDTTVEILDAKKKVVSRLELPAGGRQTITSTRGEHTIRSMKKDGTKHEVTAKLGLGEQYAVPTSPDQCFALLNIGAWYGARRSKRIDITETKVDKRMTKSEVFVFPDETYGTLVDAPRTIDVKDRPKMVTAFSCEKMAKASDDEILATLDDRLVASSTTLTSIMLEKEALKTAASKTAGPQVFERLMTEQKKEWTRVHEDKNLLVYRDKTGEVLFIDVYAIPDEVTEAAKPGSVSAFVANVDKPKVDGVYRKSDVLPSFAVRPKSSEAGVMVGATRLAGLVLRSPTDIADYKVPSDVFSSIGGADWKEIALTNANARFADAAKKCVAKMAAKASTCSNDPTEAAGIVIASAELEKLKGKVWLRWDDKVLNVAKPAKKVPTTGFGDTEVGNPVFWTLEKKELKSGLL